MVTKKSKKRIFSGMNYRKIQSKNSANRNKLEPKDKKWLKDNGYRNVGWNNVINLYQKLEDFLEQYRLKDFSLEELFLEADHIGNKYLSNQEINEFNQKLAKELNEIADQIDAHFPDNEIEVVDYSSIKPKRYNCDTKKYRTMKIR